MPTATKRKPRQRANKTFLAVPHQPTHEYKGRKAKNAARTHQKQEREPCIVVVEDGRAEPLKGCETVVLKFREPVLLDMAKLESVLNKYGLSLKAVKAIIVVIPRAPTPAETDFQKPPSPATISPALTRLQSFADKSGLAVKGAPAPEGGHVQASAPPPGPRRRPNSGSTDWSELVELIGCIQQNLKKSGYDVYRCEDADSPNCLTVARDGREYQLTVGALDGRPLIEIVPRNFETEADADGERIVRDAVTHCLSTFKSGEVA